MKYMGSKRAMLRNGLGTLIVEEARYCERVVDLFCGAGSVSWFAAQSTRRPVLAVDLQHYAAVLAKAVVGREAPINPAEVAAHWIDRAVAERNASSLWRDSVALEERFDDTKKLVKEARRLCRSPSEAGPIWNAYGGHYFSPKQALTFDYLLRHVPNDEPERAVCLAAAASAASRCAAAPGHTAQPFQPTEGAAVYLRRFWNRDPIGICESVLEDLCGRYAQTAGDAFVADALDVAERARPDDLVIVDPPYSAVQYSRFYHVLETVARGECGMVNGIGRYPPIQERPQSDFSKKGTSREALQRLVESLAASGATVILTFPEDDCSNGLSGEAVLEIARACYETRETAVVTKFSSLGGNNRGRQSHRSSNELIILMRPRA